MKRHASLLLGAAIAVVSCVSAVSGQEHRPRGGPVDAGAASNVEVSADAGVALDAEAALDAERAAEVESGLDAEAPTGGDEAAEDGLERSGDAGGGEATTSAPGVGPTDEVDAAPGARAEASLSIEVDPVHGLADDEMWVFIDKSERRMVVNDGRGWREAFRVALGQNPEGDKRWEGDGRTPEGDFYVCRRIVHNRFHRFLGISYPGPEDAEYGKRRRWLQPIEYRAIHRAHRHKRQPPWQTKLGGSIGIHGYGVRRDRAKLHARGDDWTDGCIAVTNEEIERIYDHTRIKTRVLIVP